jgi:hypothetical protein
VDEGPATLVVDGALAVEGGGVDACSAACVLLTPYARYIPIADSVCTTPCSVRLDVISRWHTFCALRLKINGLNRIQIDSHTHLRHCTVWVRVWSEAREQARGRGLLGSKLEGEDVVRSCCSPPSKEKAIAWKRIQRMHRGQ